MERRLAAILAADVVGYSRLMRQDEAGRLAARKSHLGPLTNRKIVEHTGRIAPSCEKPKRTFSSFVALCCSLHLDQIRPHHLALDQNYGSFRIIR